MFIGRPRNSFIAIVILVIITLIIIFWSYFAKQKQMVVNIETTAGVDTKNLIINLKTYSEIDANYTASEIITVFYKGQQLISSLDINNIYGYEFYINYDEQCLHNYYSDYIYYPFNENIIQNIRVRQFSDQILFFIQPAYLESENHSDEPNLESYSSCEANPMEQLNPNYKYYNDLFTEDFREILPLDEDIVNYYATIPIQQLETKNILPEDFERIIERKEYLFQNYE